MPNEEYSPEGVNPGPEGANPAWGELSWPGPAGLLRRGSPAGILELRHGLGATAWADSGVGSDPGPLEWRPGGSVGLEENPAAQPGWRTWRPTPGRRATPAQSGWRGWRGTGPAGEGPAGLAGEGSAGPAGLDAAVLAQPGIFRPRLFYAGPRVG
jgi:hypothetical protein